MLQWAVRSMFETSENTRSLSTEIKDIKKNQIKIWELKKYNSGNKKKSQWMDSTTEWRGERKELIKLKLEQ